MARKTKETPEPNNDTATGDPVREIVDFTVAYFGQVESEGRPVPGLERLKALKAEMDKK